MKNPFTKLPNEIIDEILNHLTPVEVWKFQRYNKCIEQTLDHHLLTRRHALNALMEWACQQGNLQAVEKAVSLGASPNLVDVVIVPGHSEPRRSTSTIVLASDHPDLVNHLFCLGANLQPDYVYHQVHQEIFSGQRPQLLRPCLNHCTEDQFTNLPVDLDQSLRDQIGHTIRVTLREVPAAIDKVKCWLELGADPMALHEKRYETPLSSLSFAILVSRTVVHWYRMSPRIVPLTELLLSTKPDLNAMAHDMTLKSLKWGRTIHMTACPIVASVIHMARTMSTEIMELLLEAGAKLDLPVHVELNPLVVYAKFSSIYDTTGYDFLFRHGASVLPRWYSDERGLYQGATPIYELWRVWGGRICLLHGAKFETIKLFIERHALQNIAVQFIRQRFRPRVEADDDLKDRVIMMERSRIILQLILQDINFKTTMAEEMEGLLKEVLQWERTNSPLKSIIDPILKDLLMPHVKLTTPEQ
ncbi:hypothetical protein FSPOR_7361 [Fusarium sporotrichioides]|uniref:F-box domain-containing protein n=1 Tax=Fusarium sporotrichioides TaxID=5514 RepID=A0A395RYV6_FUSSP|nr:hypothetical protein FSPOR_7361 [Fusarium sporotrichioides]